MKWRKKRDSTWGFPGVTETHSMQPCCRSSAMRGRIWRATLTEQFSDGSMGKSQKKNVIVCVLCLTKQLGLEWKKRMQQQTAEDKREKEGGFNSKRERKWWLLRENEEERNKQKKGVVWRVARQKPLSNNNNNFNTISVTFLLLHYFSSLCSIFYGHGDGDAHSLSIYFLYFYYPFVFF